MLSDSPRRREILWLAVLVEGGLGLLALGLGWLTDCPSWQNLFWDPEALLWAVGATVPLVLLFLLCVHWPVGPLAPIQRFVAQILKPLFQPCSLLDLAAVSLLAGVGEELLFRGVLQTLLSRWTGVVVALLLTSALFGLLHALTAAYALLATGMGAYLGWLSLRSGNLLVAVLTHALYDFVALTYLVKGPALGSDKSS